MNRAAEVGRGRAREGRCFFLFFIARIKQTFFVFHQIFYMHQLTMEATKILPETRCAAVFGCRQLHKFQSFAVSFYLRCISIFLAPRHLFRGPLLFDCCQSCSWLRRAGRYCITYHKVLQNYFTHTHTDKPFKKYFNFTSK